ncbi:MAG: transposase family protein, partial [Crocinitomicaceae bacterium]|nr:transposase family protein [Crocinitomicaceae bacterium]
MNQKSETLFSEIADPRRDIGIRHKLNDILHIGIIAVVCGAETWNNIEEYACAKEGFLRKFLELPNGIPTHDTFNRV